MPKRSSSKDQNVSAFAIVQRATAETKAPADKNPAAVALGRLGGLKGGPARAASLSKKELSNIAREAARSRWSKQSL